MHATHNLMFLIENMFLTWIIHFRPLVSSSQKMFACIKTVKKFFVIWVSQLCKDQIDAEDLLQFFINWLNLDLSDYFNDFLV